MAFKTLLNLLRALLVLFPFYQNGDGFQYFQMNENYLNERLQELENHQNNQHPSQEDEHPPQTHWYEEQLASDLKWSIALNSELHAGPGHHQVVDLIDTKRFGKALVTDGKMQMTEKDEFVYHESLVHPALLIHDEPKTVFIMGGGDGSSAREILKHKNIEKVIICDLDWEVVNFCREYITANNEAFNDERLQILFDDAKEELERSGEKYDIIVGDLPDPSEGILSNKAYAKSFIEQAVKPRLNQKGIFVTQAGPAGILSHKDVFAPIYITMKQVFSYVVAYIAQVPSFADSCGWVLASDEQIKLDAEVLDKRISARVTGELRYLDGPFIVASTFLNKTITTSLMKESHVITEENARFIHGRGVPTTTTTVSA